MRVLRTPPDNYLESQKFQILRFLDFEIFSSNFQILRFWDFFQTFESLRFFNNKNKILRFWDFFSTFWDFEILRFFQNFEILRFWDFPKIFQIFSEFSKYQMIHIIWWFIILRFVTQINLKIEEICTKSRRIVCAYLEHHQTIIYKVMSV